MKKGKNDLKTFLDEINKKIDLGTLVECTTTAERIINHTNTMVPNKVTSLSTEQICIDNHSMTKLT